LQPTASGRVAAWSAAGTAIVANVAGYTFALYDRWWWFDRALHAWTLFALTLWLGLFVFIGVFRPDRARGLRAFLLLLSAGVAVGAVWEVAEWGADELTSADMIKGKYDTVLDIIMDIAGSVLAALLAITVVARGSGSLLDER
jgi:hypothetical protein